MNGRGIYAQCQTGASARARPVRFERTTYGLEVRCSIQLSYGRRCCLYYIFKSPHFHWIGWGGNRLANWKYLAHCIYLFSFMRWSKTCVALWGNPHCAQDLILLHSIWWQDCTSVEDMRAHDLLWRRTHLPTFLTLYNLQYHKIVEPSYRTVFSTFWIDWHSPPPHQKFYKHD